MQALVRALGVLGTGLPAIAAAQAGPEISITRLGPLRLEQDPGGAARAVFRVTGNGRQTERLQASLILPGGWRAITGAGPLELVPGASQARIVSFSVPATATPGSYPVRFVLSGGKAVAPIASDSLLVVVRRHRRVDLKLLDAPGFSVAGKSYTARFLITNQGNAKARLRVAILSGNGLPARADSSALSIPPGASRVISVVVATRQEGRSMAHVLELQILDQEDDNQMASASSQVQVIPRAAEQRVRATSTQVELSARTTSVSRTPPQLQLSGSVGDWGATQLDFLFRGRNADRLSLREEDEYRLSLTAKGFELRVGDQLYGLSPLLEPGRNGFGGGGRLTIGPLTVGGYAQRDRRRVAGQEQRAGFVDLGLLRAVRLGVNYLSAEGYGGGAWTARTALGTGRYLAVDLEYGRGVGSRERSEAYSAHIRGHSRFLSYEVWRMRADPDFPGYYRGTAYDLGSLSVRPWRELQLTGFASRQRRRTPPGAPIPETRVDRSAEASVGYGNFVQAGYRWSEQTWNVPHAPLARVETSLRLRLGVPIGGGWLHPWAEFSERLDPLTNLRVPFRKLGLEAAANAGPGRSYSLSVGHSMERTPPSTTPRAKLSATANVAQRFGSGTRFSLSFSGNRSLESPGTVQGAADMRVEQDLPFGHRLAVRVRALSGPAVPVAEQSIVMVDYTVPLGWILPAPYSGARVTGRVLDSETGRGVQDVVVRLRDRTVITDRSGRWAFSSLEPGSYALALDPTSLPPGRTTRQELPMELVVERQRHEKVAIELVRGAQVSGIVALYEFEKRRPDDSSGVLTIAGGMEGVVVELSGPERTLRQVSDFRGRFDFAGLAPGRWKLTVVAGELPRYHYLERNVVELELAPGRREDVTLDVLPQERRVQLVDGGDLVAGRSEGRERSPSARTAPAPHGEQASGAQRGNPAMLMTEDLRNLLKSQQAYRARQGTYSVQIEPFALDYPWHREVTLRILHADGDSWFAQAQDARAPRMSCVIYVGDPPAKLRTAAQAREPREPGIPICDQ